VNFKVLGPLDVEGADGPVSLRGKRRRLLLLRFLVSPNLVVPTAQLAADVWGDRDTEAAVSTIASHISILRGLLGPERIRRRADGYTFAVGTTELDASCFGTEVEEGRAAWESGDRNRAKEVFARSLSRWHGTALADAEDAVWAVGARTMWEELRRNAEEYASEVRLELGEHQMLVASLEQAVRDEPLRERRWAQLMLALYRSGMQADALRTYQRLRGLLADELGLEPSIELALLEQSILRQDPALDWRAVSLIRSVVGGGAPPRLDGDAWHPGERPRLRDRFIGRAQELDRLVQILPTRRIVTLTGFGGIGKSRMALEASARTEGDFTEGVRWVDLSALDGSGDVVAALAGVFGIRAASTAQAVVETTQWLADRRELLIMDNCEHVLTEVRELVDVLTTSCPGVTILATSRTPLDIPGEVVWALHPLERADAMALFEERLFEIDANLRLDDDDRVRIAGICDRVEGHPLAIEIAAAQIRSRSIEDVLLMLPQSWRIGDPEVTPARHRSLGENIDWSVRLLDEHSRELFEDLCVFPSGFDATAAQAVYGGEATGRRFDFELSLLVGQSMLQIDRSRASTRYRMVESLREFGRSSARSELRRGTLRRRHADHFRCRGADLGRQMVGPGWRGGGTPLVDEWDNLRSALDWALDSEDPSLAVELVAPMGQWALRALQSEHRLWIGRCLEVTEEGDPRYAALATLAAKWAGFDGDHEEALRLARQAIRCGGPVQPSIAASWVTVAFSSGMLGLLSEVPRAMQSAEDALLDCGNGFTFVEGHAVLHPLIVIAYPERRNEHRDVVHRAAAELDNGIAHAIVCRMDVVENVRSGNIEKAAWLLPEAIHQAKEAHARSIEMDLRAMALALLQPDDPTALVQYMDVLEDLKSYDYGDTIWGVMELLGSFLVRQGKVQEAARILGHLEATGRSYPNPFVREMRVRYLDPVTSVPDVTEALSEGAGMSRSELMNSAIGFLQGE